VADPRLTEVLLLLSLSASGILICGITRAPWAFWLTAMTPALIAATGWPRSNDDDEVMRFARLAVVALAALVLGTGPAPTVMLVLIWTLAVAPLYPLLLPYRATVLTVSVATIILSAPVILRMLTEGYLPEVELGLLAVLVAATPVVAAVSYAVAHAAEPSRVRESGTVTGDTADPEPVAVPVVDDLRADDIWLTELRAARPTSDADPVPVPPAHPRDEDSGDPPAPDRGGPRSTTADTGSGHPDRPRDPNSPWAVPPTDSDLTSGLPAPSPDPGQERTDRSPDPTTGPDALVTTGELLRRITTTTLRDDAITGSTALFLVELRHRPSAPVTAHREAVADVLRRLRAIAPAPEAVLRVEENTVALIVGGTDADVCRTAAQRLSTLIEEPTRTTRGPLITRCTIGIALVDPQVRTSRDLVDAATRALARARHDDSRTWVLQDPSPTPPVESRAELEAELRQAITDRGIGVLMQPVVGVRPDHGVLRVEALARYRRADGTPVPPRQFIPVADELGLGPALGHLVLDHALAVVTAFRAAGQPLPGLSVNVSQTQLEDPEFPGYLAARLHAHHMAPDSFTLELSAALDLGSDQARSCLTMVRALGIRLCLDNVGGDGLPVDGLPDLPIDEVKLDRCLVHELGADTRAIRSIIDLAHSRHLPVVVVGVETTGQLDAATRLGADAVQGHLLAHPQTAEDLGTGITASLRRIRSHHEASRTDHRETTGMSGPDDGAVHVR
jgi:EAL domain-containing protein (putative c-di-GMP-specific phosphodiesterase class I)